MNAPQVQVLFALLLLGAMALPVQAQDLQADATPADPETTAVEGAPATAQEQAARTRTVITAPDAPSAIGPYSQAIQIGNTIYCSGQIGLNPETSQLVVGGVGTELRQAMNNIRAVLREAGYTLEDIAYTQIFLTDMSDYELVNQVYGSYFFEAPPARAVVEVAALPAGARIEIAVTAVK
jgi:2-iminobutanoate/2-iminopropanoate deaminase